MGLKWDNGDKPVNWKLLRDLLWSGLVAYAAVVFFQIMKPPEPVAAFMSFVMLAAIWVVAYNFLFGKRA